MMPFEESKPIPGFELFHVTKDGTVYRRNGKLVKQFNSVGYKQVCVKGPGMKHVVVKGVHQLVAMTFDPNYYPGCVVHHLDEDKHNNHIDNLQCLSVHDHCKHHADPDVFRRWTKEHGGPANKGKKMSDEFREHCRISALKRAERERAEGIVRNTNPNGNTSGFSWKERKETDPEAYERFCESCRQAALKREAKKREDKENNNTNISA